MHCPHTHMSHARIGVGIDFCHKQLHATSGVFNLDVVSWTSTHIHAFAPFFIVLICDMKCCGCLCVAASSQRGRSVESPCKLLTPFAGLCQRTRSISTRHSVLRSDTDENLMFQNKPNFPYITGTCHVSCCHFRR